MTIISVSDCCRLLAIDPKTLRRWLAQAQLTLTPHPTDARLKGVTGDQLRLLATAHHRSLPALPEELPVPVPTGPPPEPLPLPPEAPQCAADTHPIACPARGRAAATG